MAGWEDKQRWWTVPGEVVATLHENGRAVPVMFEYDDAAVWGLRVGDEVVVWDHVSSTMVIAPKTLGAATMQGLRDVILAMSAPSPGWGITQLEQTAIDKIALALDEGRWVTGRKLRHVLKVGAEEFAPIKERLFPRYIAQDHGDKGDYFGLTLPGLLRSSEKSRATRVIEATLRIICAKFEADPDMAGFTTEEIIAQGGLEATAGGFVDSVLIAAWLFLGGSGQGKGPGLRVAYGVPKDVEDVAKCTSVDEFMKMIRRSASPLRPWPTAPMRLAESRAPVSPLVPNGKHAMKYDVTLSFAGEDRAQAHALAERLRASGLSVFYDLYEQATLWGKDLYEHLHAVYSEQATYCVIFVSEHYARKLWTTHERKAAQERAFKERGGEYILPLRIDETRLPGLADTIGYVSITEGINRIADLLIAKVQSTDAGPAPPAASPTNVPSKQRGDSAPELALRVERRSMDRDSAGTVVVHHYELIVRFANTTKKRFNDWYLEAELPTLLLESHTTYGTLIQARSDATRSLFRTSTKLPPIPSGDAYEWRIPYRVDNDIFWKHHNALQAAAATARAFLDGALVAEVTLDKIQDF